MYIILGSSCFAPSSACNVPTDSHGREVTPSGLMWEAKEWHALMTPECETNRREISVTNDSCLDLTHRNDSDSHDPDPYGLETR